MAFALVMADKHWGGQAASSTTYLEPRRSRSALIWQHEVDHDSNDVLTPGDSSAAARIINISYFAPAYYRDLRPGRPATPPTGERVIETSYTRHLPATLNTTNGNADNGLVPAWSTPAGVPMTPPGTSMPTYYQLDSCRTPFRIGAGLLLERRAARARPTCRQISGFYAGIGVANLVDGYDLNGTPHPQFVTTAARAPPFVGPAGVGAMATGRPTSSCATTPTPRRDADPARRQPLLPGVLDRALAADDDRADGGSDGDELTALVVVSPPAPPSLAASRLVVLGSGGG